MPLHLTAQTASQALARAQARGVLPLDLSSADIRAQVAKLIRENSVFVSRMTSARAVQAVKERVERLMQGGRGNDLAQLRLELKKIFLEELGYDPATGFPGDEQLGIPPAEPGSLRDLSSDRRINFFLTTQEELMRGAAQKARGEDGSRLVQFPAWELVRIKHREVPRGSEASGTKGWVDRWIQAGGKLLTDAKGHTITITDSPFADERGQARLIALKTDPVWQALGDSDIFDDALDVSHPPFAFNSGKSWREVHHSEARALGVEVKSLRASEPQKDDAAERAVPAPKASAHGLDPATIAALKKSVKNLEARDGNLLLRNREISKQTSRQWLAEQRRAA